MRNLIIMFFILHSFYSVEWLSTTPSRLFKKNVLMESHSWLDDKLYNLYKSQSEKYKVPIEIAISVVQVESHGKNVVSRKNSNGTRDYGFFQINSVHKPDNPRKLLDHLENSKFGFWYLSQCLKKSHGHLPEAIRMYNGGLNNNRKYYKNWAYEQKILKNYLKIMEELGKYNE